MPAPTVFLLGSTLFHILTLSHPWTSQGASSIESVLRRVREGDPPRARSVAPWVDRELDKICAKAMAWRKEKRYSSADHLAAAIDLWLARRPLADFPRFLKKPFLRLLERLRSRLRGT